jgi:fructose-1-phosphate kinase PfkB-like protein
MAGEGFEPLLIHTQAPTREILTVRTESSADQTAFFDPDPAISTAEAQALCEQVQARLATGTVDALTLSGSSPAEATHGVFSDLTALAQARGVPVFLDTYGPSLASIWGFWPSVMQLNRREAVAHLNTKSAADGNLFALLERWARHGVRLGLITDGPNPVLIHLQGRRYRATPPAIQAVNAIGSGDSLLAGIVDSWLAGRDSEQMIRHSIACAVSNALTWDAGAIDVAEVTRLESSVVVEPA